MKYYLVPPLVVRGLVLILITSCICGCVTPKPTASSSGGKVCAVQEASGKPHVEIFRGLGGYMKGRQELQERLREQGISSTTWFSGQSLDVAKRIIDRRLRGDTNPIVLMGYATGGGGTREVAKILENQKIEVDAVILIDPSFFEPVPANVGYCFVAYRPEILQRWNSIMRGNPVKAECKDTKIVQIDLEEIDQDGALEGESHLTITSNSWVQELLVREVVKVVNK